MTDDRQLEQQIITNVPASPLASATPDFLMTSLVKLAQSYLQNKNVAYLGHAIKMMRPFAGNICRSNGIETYTEMFQTDPEVNKSIGILHLAGISNSIRFGAPEVFDTAFDNEQAENAARFMNRMFGQFDLDFSKERSKIVFDYLRYGNGIGEIEFGKGRGSLSDKIVIRQIRAVDLRDCVFITDSFNRIIGYAPYGFPGVMAPLDSWIPADGFITYLFDAFERQRDREEAIINTQMLPKYKVFHMQWQPTSDEPRGMALLDAAFQSWWAKQQIIPILLYLIQEWGVPRKRGVLGDKAEATCIVDSYGKPIINQLTGLQETEPPLTTLFRALEGWGSGGSLALPHGYESGIEQGDYQWVEAIIKAIEFFNRETSSAITKQLLAASQGAKSGGEKGVQSHRDVLGLSILKIKNDQSEALREQLCKPMIAANFGTAAKEYAPKADLGDADGFPVSLEELGFLAQSIPNFFTPEMFPEVGRKIGFPYLKSQNRVVLPRSAASDVAKLTALIQAQLSCNQGAFSIDFN